MDNNYNNTPQDPQNNSNSGGYQDPNANMNQQFNNNYQGQNYNQNNYNQNNNMDPMMDNTPMTLKDWIITLILVAIPCVGFIMLIIWAVSKSGNINRKRFAQAQIIIGIAVVVIYLVLMLIFGASFMTMFGNNYYY